MKPEPDWEKLELWLLPILVKRPPTDPLKQALREKWRAGAETHEGTETASSGTQSIDWALEKCLELLDILGYTADEVLCRDILPSQLPGPDGHLCRAVEKLLVDYLSSKPDLVRRLQEHLGL